MSWVIIFCSFLGFFCLLIGALAGMSWEHHCAARDARGDQAEELDATVDMAELDPLPATAQFDAIREAGRRAWAIQQQRAAEGHSTYAHAAFSGAINPPQYEAAEDQAHAAWVAHCEQAEDITREGPDVLAAIHADLDRFIAEVVHGGQQ